MTASKYNTLLTGSPHHNVPLWKRNRYWKKGRKRKMKHKFRKDSKHECRMPNMKCFTHDNYHWKTPPYWTCKLFCLIILFFLGFIPHLPIALLSSKTILYTSIFSTEWIFVHQYIIKIFIKLFPLDYISWLYCLDFSKKLSSSSLNSGPTF